MDLIVNYDFHDSNCQSLKYVNKPVDNQWHFLIFSLVVFLLRRMACLLYVCITYLVVRSIAVLVFIMKRKLSLCVTSSCGFSLMVWRGIRSELSLSTNHKYIRYSPLSHKHPGRYVRCDVPEVYTCMNESIYTLLNKLYAKTVFLVGTCGT